MSATRAIARNTAVQILGKTVSTALGLLAIGMMTRYLGVEQYGWYTTVISFLGFAGILIDFGLIPVTARMMSKPQFDKERLLKNLLGFRLATAVMFLGLAPIVALAFPYPYEVKIAISFTTLSFLCVAMNQVLIGYCQTTLTMRLQVAGEIAGRLALVAALWLLMARGAGFLWVMGAVTLSGIVYTAVLWVLTARETRIGLAYDRSLWSAIVRNMWPIAISILCNVVYLRGDALLLTIIRSQAEVGIYGAAYRVLDIIAQLAMMMMGIWLPLLAYAWSRNLKDAFKKHYQQSFDAMMLFAAPATIGIMLLAKPIMILVAGDAFSVSGNILRILALAVFGIYLGAIFGHAAVAMDKQKQTIWIYVSDAILTLAGYLFFIPRYGMWGAAWMTVFSEWYAGILLFLTVRRYAREPLSIHTLVNIMIASAVMAGAVSLTSPIHVFLRAMIGAAVYSAALLAIGGISRETIREIIHKT